MLERDILNAEWGHQLRHQPISQVSSLSLRTERLLSLRHSHEIEWILCACYLKKQASICSSLSLSASSPKQYECAIVSE